MSGNLLSLPAFLGRLFLCSIAVSAALPAAASLGNNSAGNHSDPPASDADSAPTQRLDDLRIFRPAFYAEFRPRTALDMVLQTPGFKLALGSAGRGLEGATGNVLINGSRPPAKATPITELLSDIPAAEVAAIILVPPGALDVDMASHPLLVNVVRKATSGISGSLSLGATDRASQGAGHTVSADARWTGSRLLATAASDWSRSTSITKGSITAPVAGQEAARETSGSKYNTETRQFSSTGQWNTARGADLQARLSLSEQYGASRPLSGGSSSALRSSGDSAGSGHSLALEWQSPIGGGRGAAVTALHSRSSSRTISTLTSSGARYSSTSTSATGETALRAQLQGKHSASLTYRAGVDYALNYLIGDFGYSINGQPVAIEGSASEVEERRTGLFFAATWTPSSRLITDASLRHEQSTLTNHGPSPVTQDIGDWRPRIRTSWKPSATHTFSAELERNVGQLAFSQFLAGVQLQDQIVTAGARALDPERSWVFGLDYELRYGERGLLNAGWEREYIENPIGSVPLDSQSDVTANVGPATVDTLQLSLSSPLDDLGIAGGHLSATLASTPSSTADMVGGQDREVSGYSSDVAAQVSLRQTLEHGAWGVSGSNGTSSTYYGVRQIRQSFTDPTASVFGEWRPVDALSARVTILKGRRSISRTAIYALPRNDGPPGLLYTSTSTGSTTWQARVRWEPTADTSLDLAVSPATETVVLGETTSNDPAATGDTRQSVSLADRTISAQLKMRW